MDDNSFIYFWLNWVVSAVPGLSLVAVLSPPLVAASLGSGALALGVPASVAVAHGLGSCGARA